MLALENVACDSSPGSLAGLSSCRLLLIVGRVLQLAEIRAGDV